MKSLSTEQSADRLFHCESLTILLATFAQPIEQKIPTRIISIG